MTEASPDHSTLSRTRRLIDMETHEAVFTWVMERLSAAGLVRGKTVGVNATTLEANAAMLSIERRDTGESCEAFIQRLAEASGVKTPTRADLARFDRSRKTLRRPGGATESDMALGWEDVRERREGMITRRVTDDTFPGGPTEHMIEYHAPFDQCDREQDYRTARAAFPWRTSVNEPEAS